MEQINFNDSSWDDLEGRCFTPGQHFDANNRQVTFEIRNGSMQIKRDQPSGPRFLSFSQAGCDGSVGADPVRLQITLNLLYTIDHVHFVVRGGPDANDSDAYVIVPYLVLPVPSEYNYVADVTSAMPSIVGTVGPIRFVYIQSTRPRNELPTFGYNIHSQLVLGRKPDYQIIKKI